MTVPAPVAVESTKGDSIDLFFRVKARDVNGVMQYRDITGVTVRSQVRANIAAADVQFEFVCTLSDQTATPGGVLLHASPAKTVAIPGNTSVYDVEITFAPEDVRTVLTGEITWISEVTR